LPAALSQARFALAIVNGRLLFKGLPVPAPFQAVGLPER
jgi:hypothetical protein